MKVYIGPYKKGITFSRVLRCLKLLGVKKDRIDSIDDRLWYGRVGKLRAWLLDHTRKQKVRIRVDPYDTWAADWTLAMITASVIEKLRETHYGHPMTWKDDGPPEFRDGGENLGPPEDGRDFHAARWDWILDEIIWTMKVIRDRNGRLDDEEQVRVSRGLLLFCRYFHSLGD